MQIVVKALNGKTICLSVSPLDTVKDLEDMIRARQGTFRNFAVQYQSQILNPELYISDYIEDTGQASISQIWQINQLDGGKGGFGALLRSIGRDPSKTTTNYDACRDLNGRRIRDVKNQQNLQDWHSEEEKRKVERQKEREMREQIKKDEREQQVQAIQDTVQEKQRQAAEKGSLAISQGLKNQKKYTQQQDKPTKKRKIQEYLSNDDSSNSESDSETKSEAEQYPSPRKAKVQKVIMKKNDIVQLSSDKMDSTSSDKSE